MNAVKSEAQILGSLFDALETRLEKQYQKALAGFAPDPIEERGAAQLEEQIVSAEKRIARLVRNRNSACDTLPGELKALAAHAGPLRDRTRRLRALLDRNAAQFRQLQGTVRGSLQELQPGTEYLNSMRANCESQPKFIDMRE